MCWDPVEDDPDACSMGAIDETRDVEVVSEIATPIAASVIATIFDLDPEDHKRFKHWVEMIGRMTPIAPDDATAAAIRNAIEEEDAYFRAVIDQRRRASRNDVVSLLIGSELARSQAAADDLTTDQQRHQIGRAHV